MMIVMGGGVVVTYCAHSQRSTMGVEHKMAGKGCHKKSPCMTVTVMKLAPTQQASTQHIDFHTVVCDLPNLMQSLGDLTQPWASIDGKSFITRQWHSPPRWYLTLLTVLQL